MPTRAELDAMYGGGEVSQPSAPKLTRAELDAMYSEPAQQVPATSAPATSALKPVQPTRSEHPARKYTAPPSTGQVIVNAANKGAMAIGDMFGNAGVNTVNLLTAGGGLIAHKAGLIDEPPDLPLEPQNMFRKAGEATGIINPEHEPQTEGQRIADTATQGVIGGLLTGGSGGVPAALTSALAGGVGAGTSQYATEKGAPASVAIPLGMLAGIATGGGINRVTGQTQNLVAQQQNAVKDEGFRRAREAGLAIPISQSNPNSLLANTIDVIAGGRPRMQQAAAIKNQPRVTNITGRQLGIADDTPITPELLQNIRNEAIDAGYNPVRNAGMVQTSPQFQRALDDLTAEARTAQAGFANYNHAPIINAVESVRSNAFDAGAGIAQMRILRSDASAAFRNGDADMGRALRGASNAIEDELEAHLTRQGNPQALENFRNARQRIAMTASAEDALNEATGTVSAQNLGRQLDRGVPLSGGMRDIAVASKLPGASLADTKYATTGASQLEMLAALGLGGAGVVGGDGDARYAALAALPMLRAGVRNVALTRPVGNALGTPSYNTYRLTRPNTNALVAGSAMDAERKSDK